MLSCLQPRYMNFKKEQLLAKPEPTIYYSLFGLEGIDEFAQMGDLRTVTVYMQDDELVKILKTASAGRVRAWCDVRVVRMQSRSVGPASMALIAVRMPFIKTWRMCKDKPTGEIWSPT